MVEKIKNYYLMGLYTKEMVHKFVEKGVITEAQYAEIVNRGNNGRSDTGKD